MTETDSPTSPRVIAAVNRLRLVQADFADAPPEQRRQYLSDEIERALGAIVPEDRSSFLKALGGAFPSWDGAEQAGATAELPTATNGTTSTDIRELNDPSFLAGRLCELAPSLNDSTKEALLSALRKAGAVPTAVQSPWSVDDMTTLRSKLALTDQKKMDPQRLLELTTLLTEFSTNLHQLVGTAWRTIAPTTDVKHRAGSLQNAMGRFVASDASMNKQQLAGEVERLRQLVASLIAGVGEAGRQFAQTYNSRFSPPSIRAATSTEGGGMFSNAEVKCWRKYVELWDTLDDSAIEREIRETIAKFAESIMKGISRT